MTIAVSLLPLPAPDLLEPEWRALEARAAPTFYQRWDWVSARLATAPQHQVWLLRATRGGETVALAFATLRTVRRKGLLPARILFLNDFGDEALDIACVEYNDLLLHGEDADAIRTAVCAWLAACPSLLFDALSVRSCLAVVEQALAATGLSALVEAQSNAAAIDLAAARKAGGVLELASANTRQQVRRAMRLYAERGALVCEPAADEVQALQWLDRLAQLHATRWQRADLIGTPYRRFLDALVQRNWSRGSIELVRIRGGDVEIGYNLNFIEGPAVRFYLGALAYEDDARLKPGLVTHALNAQMHSDAGRDCYDFLAGDARYKLQLGKPTVVMRSVLFRRKRLAFQLEDAARSLKRVFRPSAATGA